MENVQDFSFKKTLFKKKQKMGLLLDFVVDRVLEILKATHGQRWTRKKSKKTQCDIHLIEN